jgi:hypothetical protein
VGRGGQTLLDPTTTSHSPLGGRRSISFRRPRVFRRLIRQVDRSVLAISVAIPVGLAVACEVDGLITSWEGRARCLCLSVAFALVL